MENSIRCFIKALHDGTKKHYGVCYCLTLVKGRGKRRTEWGQRLSSHTWSWPVWLFVFLAAELQNIQNWIQISNPFHASNQIFKNYLKYSLTLLCLQASVSWVYLSWNPPLLCSRTNICLRPSGPWIVVQWCRRTKHPH